MNTAVRTLGGCLCLYSCPRKPEAASKEGERAGVFVSGPLYDFDCG